MGHLVIVKRLIITCSHVDIPGLDPAQLIAGHTPVGLSVNILLVVAGLEGGEDQVPIVHHLQQSNKTLTSPKVGNRCVIGKLVRSYK